MIAPRTIHDAMKIVDELCAALESVLARLSVPPIGLSQEELTEITIYVERVIAEARGPQ
jgi:hypothetical protein